MSVAVALYKNHRYPVEVISYCVWLYFRFLLSFREVEELMLERGVVVSYETVRRWCGNFEQPYDPMDRRPDRRIVDDTTEVRHPEILQPMRQQQRLISRELNRDLPIAHAHP